MQSYYNTPVKIVNYGKSLTKRDFHLQNGISDYKMCFSFTKWDSRVTNGNLVLQFIIIQNKIKENGCLCTKVSRNVYKIRRIQKKSIDFSVSNRYYEYSSLTLHTSALYQVENAVAAMSAVAYLEDDAMTKAVVRKGI